MSELPQKHRSFERPGAPFDQTPAPGHALGALRFGAPGAVALDGGRRGFAQGTAEVGAFTHSTGVPSPPFTWRGLYWVRAAEGFAGVPFLGVKGSYRETSLGASPC